MATLTNGQDCDLTDSQPIVKIGQPQRSNRQPIHNSYLNVCGREAGKPANRRSTDSASNSVNTLFAYPIQGLNTHTCIALPCVSKASRSSLREHLQGAPVLVARPTSSLWALP